MTESQFRRLVEDCVRQSLNEMEEQMLDEWGEGFKAFGSYMKNGVQQAANTVRANANSAKANAMQQKIQQQIEKSQAVIKQEQEKINKLRKQMNGYIDKSSEYAGRANQNALNRGVSGNARGSQMQKDNTSQDFFSQEEYQNGIQKADRSARMSERGRRGQKARQQKKQSNNQAV